MNTDRSIRPLVAQFVPLKIDTASPDWQSFEREYRSEGNGIPKIYIIRADGEKLYARSGALDGDTLPRFLQFQLQRAGKVFSPAQARSLEEMLATARAAHESGDISNAVKELAALKKMGVQGSLGSYAQAALEADEFVKQLTEQGRAALEEVEKKLTSGDDSFACALTYVEAKDNYGALATMKTALAEAARKYTRDDKLRDVLPQAEAVQKARELAKSPRGEKRAADAFEKVIDRYPNSPAAEVAREELLALGGVAPPADTPPAEAPAGDKPALREWTDKTGKYTLRAKFNGIEDGAVLLIREDGKQIRVPLVKLSEDDQQYAREQ